MRQSTTEDNVRATGKASPANPPMAAPMPVGTIITDVYALLNFGCEKRQHEVEKCLDFGVDEVDKQDVKNGRLR